MALRVWARDTFDQEGAHQKQILRERLLLTAALFALLSIKAGREEAFLNEKHGERYRAYAAYVPQLFPTIDAVRGFVLRE